MSTPSLSRSRRPLWLVEGLDIAEQRRLIIVAVTALLAAVGIVVSLIAPGIVPPTPGVGAAVGFAALLLGYAGAVAVDAADLTVQGPRHVRAAGAELVAVVPSEPTLADAEPLARAVLDARDRDERVLLGLAATGRDTATTVAWTDQLGVALARQGVSVLTADLASGRSDGPGLFEVLDEGRRLGAVAEIDPELRLARVTAGADLRRALDGLTELAPRLPRDLDVLLVALPTAASREVVAAATALDHLLVVIERGVTARVDLIAALDALERSETPSQAVLVDDVTVARLTPPESTAPAAGWTAESPPADPAAPPQPATSAPGAPAPEAAGSESGAAAPAPPPDTPRGEPVARDDEEGGSLGTADAEARDAAGPPDAAGSRDDAAASDAGGPGEGDGPQRAAEPVDAIGERGVRLVPPTVPPSPRDPAPETDADLAVGDDPELGAPPDAGVAPGAGAGLGEERDADTAPGAGAGFDEEPEPHTAPGAAAESDIVEGRDADVLRAAGAARAREVLEHRPGEDETTASDDPQGAGPDDADAGSAPGSLTAAEPDPSRHRPRDSVPSLAPDPPGPGAPPRGAPDVAGPTGDRSDDAREELHEALEEVRDAAAVDGAATPAGEAREAGKVGEAIEADDGSLVDTDELQARPAPRGPDQVRGPRHAPEPDQARGPRRASEPDQARGPGDVRGPDRSGPAEPDRAAGADADERLLDPAATSVGPEDAELGEDDDALHTTAQLAILVDELEDREQRP